MSNAIASKSDYRQLLFVAKSWLEDAGIALEALSQIKKEKLYKQDGYKTFETFCEEELGNSVRRINQILSANKVVQRIENGKNFSQKPNESQARALSKAPEEKQSEVWDSVTSECEAAGEKVTAKRIEEAVARVGDDGLDSGMPQHTVHQKKSGSPKISTKDRTDLQKTFAALCRKLNELGMYESLLDELDAIQGAIKS